MTDGRTNIRTYGRMTEGKTIRPIPLRGGDIKKKTNVHTDIVYTLVHVGISLKTKITHVHNMRKKFVNNKETLT